MTDAGKQSKTVKVVCGECGGQPRNHKIVREFQYAWSDPEDEERGEDTYQICQCLGCDTVRFRVESYSTFDPEGVIRVYPEVPRYDRSFSDTTEYPHSVGRIYLETVNAYNSGALILAGGGLRAIVEAVCIEQEVEGQNLQRKIDALVSKGLLAKPQADLLHEERYIGNAALHEVAPPSRRDIEDGLAIVEGLLATIYQLPERAQRLRQQRESRGEASSG